MYCDRQTLISVIMGVYRPDGRRLKLAIQSLLNQTIENWELILYDDGSGAAYEGLLQEAAELDSRIVLVRGEKNRGLAHGLNRCLKVAKGSYIARMDDDDFCHPERFQRQLEFLQTHPQYGWVGTNAVLFDEKGLWGQLVMPEQPEDRDFLRYSPYIHPSVMFRREVFGIAHGYITARVTKRCEDYELFMRLHMRGCRGYNIQETLFFYREDMKSHGKRTFASRVNESRIRYRGFRRLGILSPRTWPSVLRPIVGGLIPVGRISYLLRRNGNGVSLEDRQAAAVYEDSGKIGVPTR